VPSGAIDAAAFVSQGEASLSVGSLGTTEVTGLLAQAAAVSGQGVADITTSGVGKFAMSPQQLEGAGFLKPGTVQQFLSDPSNITSVLSSPTVWTGRSGVDGLGALLSDEGLQDRVQQELMVNSLSGLQQAGVINGTESPDSLAPFVQTATKFGVNTAVDWARGQAPADLVNSINGVAKGAQYAVNFVSEKLPETLGSGVRLGGFVDTVNRGALDQAVNQIINNPKIPVPNFSQTLYSGSTNEQLTYSGDDAIVWDRVNAERVRRGLPPLDAVGSPRPA
jgi:hypothetical protein